MNLLEYYCVLTRMIFTSYLLTVEELKTTIEEEKIEANIIINKNEK